MAKTGISIVVSNAVFGTIPNVDANSMLIVAGAVAESEATAFSLDTPYLLRSAEDLDDFITVGNNPDIVREVTDFFAPKSGINNNGTVLWLVGVTTFTTAAVLLSAVRATAVSGFQYRPRNVMISQIDVFAARPIEPSVIQTAVDTLYTEGFSIGGVILGDVLRDAATPLDTLEDLTALASPMVSVCVVAKTTGVRASVGAIGGFMASLSVGTSIGDASLGKFASDMYFTNQSALDTYVNTHCAGITLTQYNTLGTDGYLFARTRPPFNGLYLNDGATCELATTALSSLEATRTIASLVDELRTFLTPFINGKVPVKSDGDIQAAYKQVVIDDARNTVIVPYIQSGDISDAAITIDATDDDMVTNKSWKVTLSVLGAPTLRWVDGYVFYVSSL